MDASSPYTQARQLEVELAGLLSRIDSYDLAARPRTIIQSLKRLTADVRLDMRDYEYAETRVEQGRHARAARKRLASLRQGILAASEHGIFTAVDVVQLSTRIDTIADQLA